jgi:superfamily II DNA helicase RecQ
MRIKAAGYPDGFRSLIQYQAYWLLKQRTHHMLYVAGTGSGKTASIQLAVQSLGPECQVLLLLPYKALYAEMEERMRKFGLSVVHYDTKEEFPSAQVIISTPGALSPTSHLLQGVKQRANNSRLLAIVIDEAVSCLFLNNLTWLILTFYLKHTLLEDADWRADIQALNRQLHRIPNVVIALMTGTISPQFEGDLWQSIGLATSQPTYVLRAPSTQRPNICYKVISINMQAKFHEKEAVIAEWKKVLPLLQRLQDDLGPHERGIIYTIYKDKVELWAKELGYPFIHGSVPDFEREKTWKAWHKGTSPVIVANKAGMCIVCLLLLF